MTPGTTSPKAKPQPSSGSSGSKSAKTRSKPKYTLTYFDTIGHAQATRYMFALAGVDFDDRRVSEAEWRRIQRTVPLEQLPVLEVEGMGALHQSVCIDRFVAKQLGFYGKTDVEAAQIDQIHTTIAEAGRLVMPFVQNMFATSPSDVQPVAVGLDTEEGVEKLRTHLPRYLNFLNSQVVANETVNGQDAEGVYFVGTSLSLADIYWACAWEIATELDTENTLLEDYPKLFNLAKRVSKLPAIQEYKRQHAEDHP
ncbi:hematopoietic prostaglandin D synthase-like [Sycon ciliatum]|uniref:hematopoietic prostaglandin D synthase-like n=1 Tax=Sycon ciliatum TaxID=27933 RepID=UPI0031F63D61